MKNNRRELLKTLTLGGGVVTLSHIPTTWSRPVVESVVLPVHAQTTEDDQSPAQSQPVSNCICAGSTGNLSGSNVTGGISIRFDGESICSIDDNGEAGFNIEGLFSDEILFIDIDQSSDADIFPGFGSNWTTEVAVSDLVDGTYSYTVTRSANPNNGVAFEITITFLTSGSDPTKTLTATLDCIELA
jgi:hypothetical protein